MNLNELMETMNHNLGARVANPSNLGKIQNAILEIAASLPTMTTEKWNMLTSSVITVPESMGIGYESVKQTAEYLDKNQTKTFENKQTKTR